MWIGLLPAIKNFAGIALKSADKTKLLFAAGTIGVVGTGICAAKATPKAMEVDNEIVTKSYDLNLEEDARKRYVLERRIKEVAPLYLPAIACGVISVACFGISNHRLATKAAASAALAGTLEHALESYSSKTLKVAGEETYNKIQKAIADDIPDKILEKTRDRYLTEADAANLYSHTAHDVLWYDCVTNRIFWATEAKILDAESKVNQQIIQEQVATISDFYANLYLESEGSALRALGWDSGDSMVDSMSIVFGSKLDPETHIPMNSINYRWKVVYPHEGHDR